MISVRCISFVGVHRIFFVADIGAVMVYYRHKLLFFVVREPISDVGIMAFFIPTNP